MIFVVIERMAEFWMWMIVGNLFMFFRFCSKEYVRQLFAPVFHPSDAICACWGSFILNLHRRQCGIRLPLVIPKFESPADGDNVSWGWFLRVFIPAPVIIISRKHTLEVKVHVAFWVQVSTFQKHICGRVLPRTCDVAMDCVRFY